MTRHETLEMQIDVMREALHGERNIHNRGYFADQPPWGRGPFRAVPKANGPGGIPFVLEPDISLWSAVLDIDIRSYYADADYYLASQIAINLHKLNVLRDNTWHKGEFNAWPGVAFELSMFGMDVGWHDDRSPWIRNGPLLKDYDDLDRLTQPDFFKSGLMPLVHENHARLCERVGDRLSIVFPEWTVGPFGIAAHLRGVNDLLLDCLAEPEWVSRLMRFIVDCQFEYNRQRAKFIGRPIDQCLLYDDEVDCPTISPAIYRDLILPLEKEICEFHGGLTYFHSCGNLTKLIPLIREIPFIRMFHIGPWTDPAKAVEAFSDGCAFDVCLDPIADVLHADEGRQRRRLREILSVLHGRAPFSIRADAFQKMEDWRADYRKILSWCEIARSELGSGGPR